MKKIASLVVFLLVIQPLFVFSQNQSSQYGIKEKSKHYYLIDGLKQFPYKYSTSRGNVRATFSGFYRDDRVRMPSGLFLDSFVFKLTTDDGYDLDIQVVGTEISLAFLLHEVSPQTGKYKFWKPVLEFQGKYNDWTYSAFEIEVIGRFRGEQDDPKDPNKVTGYQNEVY